MHVLVNQLGSAPGDPINAVIRCSDGESPPDRVELRRARSDVSEASTTPERAGRVDDWRDWTFWTATLPAPERGSESDGEGEGEAESGSEYVVAATRDAPGGDDVVADDGAPGSGVRDIARSHPFRVEPDLERRELLPLVLSYIRSVRCTGAWDRADRTATFAGDRDDAVDVRGGWYDASGDRSKYLSHLSYANYYNPQQIPLVIWSLLEVADRLPVADGTGAALVGGALEEARYGVDFLVRAQDDAGYFYQVVFDGWSGDPEEREICAFEGFDGERTDDYEAGFRQGGGVAIAALARASRNPAERAVEDDERGSDHPNRPDLDHGEFDRETYREAAIEGFEHLQARNDDYLDDGTENLLDDYCALLAATELAGATGEDRFAEAAVDRARSLLAHQTDAGWFESGPDDEAARPFYHATDEGLPIVALCRFLEVLDGEPTHGGDVRAAIADDVRSAIRKYWRFELDLTDGVVNPFGYARQYARAVDEDEPRARFFMPHENETGYWWLGENARIASLASAALASVDALDASDPLDGSGRGERTPDADDRALESDLRRFADDQLAWILGCNPFDVSMLEGVGYNADPFVPEAPQVPGGISNGITAGVEDESDVAFVPEDYGDDPEHSWRWSEQWLPHGAWFVVALARRHRSV